MSPGKILTGQPAQLPPLRTVMSDEDKLFVAALNLELKDVYKRQGVAS